MPSKSAKQARFMAAAAHDPAFAKRAGISMSVARDFNQADAGGGLLKAKYKHIAPNKARRAVKRKAKK